MTDEQYDIAIAKVPAPKGFIWCLDYAANGTRLRLFGDRKKFTGQVCVAYVDGGWFVDDPSGKRYQAAANGEESDLHNAMRRALKVSIALGWKL